MSNPYEPPQTPLSEADPLGASSTAEIRFSMTPHCPFCQVPISRFAVWNSLGAKTCPQCQAKLWLQLPPVMRMIFLPLAMLVTPSVVFMLRWRVNLIWVMPPLALLAVFAAQVRWGYIAGVAAKSSLSPRQESDDVLSG